MNLDAAHACVVDLDGVVWLSGTALPGALEGVAELRHRGIPVLFCTNNSTASVATIVGRLAAIGIEAITREVITSAQAAASLLSPGDRALVVGEVGIDDALHDAGVVVVTERPSSVVVGLTARFDYDVCDRAATHVRHGARYIATNDDATLPTPSGLKPGAGAIVASISVAAGKDPELAGKPWPAMCALVRARVHPGAVVGDRASTDGRFAAALGVRFAHVVSQVGDETEGAAVTVTSLHDAVLALCG